MNEKTNEYIDIVTMKIKDVNVATYNPRDISDEELAGLRESIKKFGFVEPLVFNLNTKTLVGGHQRLKAAELEGYTEVPVSLVRLTLAEEKALNVALNSHTISGKFNNDILRPLLAEIKLELPDTFSALNFGAFDLPDLKIENLEQGGSDEGPGELPVQPKTRLGDVWVLGKHRVMCGDSTDVVNIERLMNGKRAEMVFTDPPYRMETAGGGFDQTVGESIKKKMDAIKHLCSFDPVAFLNTLPVVFEKNVMNCYIFCNKDLVPDYLNWALEAGYNFNILFWKKPNAMPMGGSHRPDVEYLLLFRRSATWNNALPDVNYSKCLEFGRVTDAIETGGHPTPKPIELIENEILISSKNEGVVVDFFMGSGSTLIAAHKRNRACYGMELDAKYVDVIVNRWQKFSGQDAVLEETGETYAEVSRH